MTTPLKMKFAAAALALAVAAMPAAFAQDQQQAPPPPMQQGPPPVQMQGGRGMNPEHQLKHLTRELNLNSDQQREAHRILKERDERIEALRQNTALPPHEAHQQMRSIMMDSDAKLRATLNPDQQQRFDTMRAEQRQKMEERRGGGAGPQGPPPAEGQAPPPQQ